MLYLFVLVLQSCCLYCYLLIFSCSVIIHEPCLYTYYIYMIHMLYVLLIHIGMDQFEITISMVNYLLYVSAFWPRGSLDRRVNCRRVSQPRWVGARQDTKGENSEGKPRPSCCPVPRAAGCACSRGLQAFARERERERARALHAGPFSRAANLSVREPWTFLL